MKVLEKIICDDFPLKWANLDCYSESIGFKKEIYLIKNENLVEDLILMFFNMFKSIKNNIYVYNSSWWDYCLDTWDVNNDEYNYELNGKSQETKDYLNLLKESVIEQGYSGNCKCNDWTKFLSISLACIITHQAPYSPVFYNEEYDFFFYFHYSGSIGLYYRKNNELIDNIIKIANEEYDLRYK